MNKNAIGIFDSGLGGLSAVREMLEILPRENIIYFGDTGRVPYGSKSVETITKYALQDARFLKHMGVKFIVAACGTVSSVVRDLSEELEVPYTGVVRPTCVSALFATKNGRIGVIGTSATIASHSYKNQIEKQRPEYVVTEQDCPLFVPLVENGLTDENDEIVRLTVSRYLKKLKDAEVDTVILGCTHYPLLSSAIRREMGENVTLIDSGKETALYTAKVLAERSLLNTGENEGEQRYYVSDTPDDFEKYAGIFLKRNIANRVTRINIEEY